MKILFNTMLFIFIFGISLINAQEQLKTPDVLNTGTMEEQMEYLHQRTNIYNNFRAIREDIFQKMRKNTLDSMLAAKKEILELNNQIESITASKDSIAAKLQNTRDELNIAIKNRDSLFLFGIPMNKVLYNTIMWMLVGGLILVTVLVFILFNRNRIITNKTQKESEELREEFNSYRQSNREKIEQMVINHFNEIKRLKGER